MKSWSLALLWLLLSAITPGLALAESSVVVLGLRSLDGDDDQARDVSTALREAARGVDGFKVSDRDVSLAQMSLAHGCDEPDVRCMADIATTLRVDRLIYGTMARNGSDLQIALFNFDAVTGQIQSSSDQSVGVSELAPDALASTTQRLMDRLLNRRAVGSLRVICDIPGAEVSVDGAAVGTTNPRGELSVPDVTPGKHTVTLRTSDHSASRDAPVMVGENATATVRVLLKPRTVPMPAEVPEPPPGPAREEESWQPQSERREPGAWRRIVGWSSVGLAAGLAGATVYSWVRIKKINNDPDLVAYRAEWTRPSLGGPSNVCSEAKAGQLAVRYPNNLVKADLESSARSLCQEADSLEVLQYVFLGSAVAFGGLGTYLLLSSPKSKKQVSFTPLFSPGHAQLRARMSF